MAQSEMPGGIPAGEVRTEAAFRATLPEMTALGETGLLPINLDVLGSITLVLGTLPELRALRPEIEKNLPTFNLERFDKLEQYTLALNQAHALHRGALGAKSSIADLSGEVAELRDRLLSDAQSLANHRLINGERLKECKRSPAYRAIAGDVFTLVALFKEHWQKVERRTPVSADLLQQASDRALELLGAIGEKEQAPVTVGEAALSRQQAFTLFFKAYEDARRAVEYLRRDHGDANTIAPSFFAGRSRGSSAAATSGGEATTLEPKAKPTPAVGGDLPPVIQINNPHNLPVDSPFVP